MEKWVIIMFFFTAQHFVCWGQDRVEQPPGEMTANEADHVTLTCNYTTKTTNVYLFWYKHLSNKYPTFILNKYPVSEGTTESDFKKRFYAKLDTTSRTVPLMIKNLRVSDSAVYYCALRRLYKNLTHSNHVHRGDKINFNCICFFPGGGKRGIFTVSEGILLNLTETVS
uniref:Ig-like domain-containing protein n=1 Tax=Cyprinus carpio TaxID=7962 RepID=A0A8C2I637_CYPCA